MISIDIINVIKCDESTTDCDVLFAVEIEIRKKKKKVLEKLTSYRLRQQYDSVAAFTI